MKEAPVLILTHGWLMNRRVWQLQESLKSHFQVLLWDLPRHGQSSKEGGVIGLQECAEALRRLLESHTIKSAIYVGWSMGMTVFWKYLELYGAGPIQNVINVEMLPFLRTEDARPDDVAKSFRRDRARAEKKFMGNVFREASAIDREAIFKAGDQVPLESALKLYHEMSTTNFSEIAATFIGRQDLIVGRHGFIAHRENEFAQLLPGAQVHWFEHSGHAPFIDEAEKFNELIFVVVQAREKF
jgi:non-heme chloroperoxidase